MTPNADKISLFWQTYLTSIQEGLVDNPIPESWSFGDSSTMADDLLKCVLSGEKTATSGMLLDYQYDKTPIPKMGDKSIILDGSGDPVCVIEIINVQIKKFKEVDEEFALKEGEGFRSLNDWKDAHWDFFTRRCQALGVTLSEEITVVCEEFKILFKDPKY